MSETVEIPTGEGVSLAEQIQFGQAGAASSAKLATRTENSIGTLKGQGMEGEAMARLATAQEHLVAAASAFEEFVQILEPQVGISDSMHAVGGENVANDKGFYLNG